MPHSDPTQGNLCWCMNCYFLIFSWAPQLQGLTFFWGTSEWSAQQIQEAISIADKLLMCRPVAEQNQYNLLERKKARLQVLAEDQLSSTFLCRIVVLLHNVAADQLLQ